MICRNVIKCKVCESVCWLRVDRPVVKIDRYLFSCPSCTLDIIVTATQSPLGVIVESDDCNIMTEDKPFKFDKISGTKTLSSHYPVYEEIQNEGLLQGGSPKLYYCSVDYRGYLKYEDAITYLTGVKEHLFGEHKNLLTALEKGNLDLARKILANSKFKNNPIYLELDDRTLFREAYSYLCLIFYDILSKDLRTNLYNEYYKDLNQCIENKEGYTALLKSFREEHGYKKNRSKLFSLHKRLMLNVESYLGGFILEYASDGLKQNIDKCRLYRADFDTVKSLYLDIFELISKTTIYIVPIINLSRRGCYNTFSVEGMNLNKFKKLSSFNKLKFIEDLPYMNELFQSVNRQMRNNIGHFSASYDTESGNVNFDSGESENYLIFLNNLLQAIKALNMIYIIYSKLDMDSATFLKESIKGNRG